MTSKRHGISRVPNSRSHSFAPRSINRCLSRSTASRGRPGPPARRVLTSVKSNCLPSRATMSTSPPPGALKLR